MGEENVPRSVEQRIVIKFLVEENVPSAEIHHRLQQQYGEECLLLPDAKNSLQDSVFSPLHFPILTRVTEHKIDQDLAIK